MIEDALISLAENCSDEDWDLDDEIADGGLRVRDAVRKELLRAASTIEELRKYKARFEWLTAEGHEIERQLDGSWRAYFAVSNERGDLTVWVSGEAPETAIDKAMGAES